MTTFAPQRYDWFADKVPTAVFRMPTAMHETAGAWFSRQEGKINEYLSRMALCGLPDVSFRGNPSLEMPGRPGVRIPDQNLRLHTSFGEGKRYSPSQPRVIFETACSQPLISVLKKAWEYLHCFDGEIHAVIVCNMSYPITLKEDFRVTIGVWTRKPTSIDGESFDIVLVLAYILSAEEDFPLEEIPYDHEVKPYSTQAQEGQEEEELTNIVDSSTSISDGGTSATVASEGTTRNETLDNLREFCPPKETQSIWRRSENPIVSCPACGPCDRQSSYTLVAGL
jgi:hypothetical protein